MFDFFKKIRKDDQGVLSNLKTVTRWVKDLPAGDIYSAQEQVVKHMIQFNKADAGFTKDRLQVLMHLDEETRDMQSSLCAQYLRNARMSKSIESRLWIAIHAFYWEITRSYHGFLMDFVANPGGSKIQTHIPLITVRAIRGFADIIKWRYFRYDQIDEKLWLRLHNLYRVAEFDNFSTGEVQVYNAENRQHSPAQEYGKALLLSLFGNGSLVPKDIEMADQWLSNWNELIRIDSLYNPSVHTFYVDTSKGHGLRRCRNQISDPTLRFVSTGDLLTNLASVVEALKAGTTPASLGLTEEFRLPEGYSLLNQVEKEWSPLDLRERRASERVQQSGQWKVIHGLQSICSQLTKSGAHQMAVPGQTPLSPEEILDIKLYGFVTERTKTREREMQAELKPRCDLWEQADTSHDGAGYNVDQVGSDWIKVGRLIAVSPAGSDDWRLAIITRLARKGESARQVGVKHISGSVQPIVLKPQGGDQHAGYIVDDFDHASDAQNIKGILLTDDDGVEKLLIDGASYARNRQYQIRSPFGQNRIIRLDSVEESGESWLKVAFEAIAI